MVLEERQCFSGLRLHKLVLTFIYHPCIIINLFFAGQSQTSFMFHTILFIQF